MKKRFSEEQIIGFLKEADKGVPVKDLCRKHGFSDASFYLWRGKYGGMELSDAKRLREFDSLPARVGSNVRRGRTQDRDDYQKRSCVLPGDVD